MVHLTLEALLADDLFPLMGVKASCTGPILSRIKSKSLCRSTALILFKTLWHLESMKRGAVIKIQGGDTEFKKDFLLSFRTGKRFQYCEGKTGFISRYIKFVKIVLNAHKESYTQSRRTRQRRAIFPLNRGTYHSLTVTAPLSFGHSLEPKTAFPQHIKTPWHKSQWHPLRQTME